MFIILGADGHVGSATAGALLDAGEAITAVLHGGDTAAQWRERGADIAVVDLHDSDALRDVLRTGSRAFLLNPPADVSTDTENEEGATARSIVAALEGSGLETVVAASTYGAQPGERCGDLNILYDFEQALAAQQIPATIQRGAYYMSNWDAQLEAAKAGSLTSMLPAEMKLPMVAPDDLGKAAARRLREPAGRTRIDHVEGPERYSPRDVADAFAAVLKRSVELEVIKREDWESSFRKLGFSAAAANSYARMTAVSVDADFTMTEPFERGETTLMGYIEALVGRSQS